MGFWTKWVQRLLILALLACLAAAYFLCLRPVTTVILIRHAEKNIEPNNPNPDLSPEGQARARELVRVLGNAGITAIYASQFRRTQQTVQPLADQLHLQVNQVEASNTNELGRQIRAHPGEVILITGHNNTVPQIIGELGGGHFPIIPENEFDNLFIVTVYRFRKAKVVKLKYGQASPSGGGTGTMVP